LILETIFETATGTVSVCDFMPPNDGDSTIHRIVECREGTVEMHMELIVRYEYGAITPWATATGDGLVLVAARDGLRLRSSVRLVGKDKTTVACFSVSGDVHRTFSLAWFPSVTQAPLPLDSLSARHHTRHYWRSWVGRCTYNGGTRDLVVRSLINGIWEVRGPRRHCTHSKIMAWVAFDRAVTLAEGDVLPAGSIEHWRQLRDEIHAEVCEKGFDPDQNSFTQYYGSTLLDASPLLLAPVGFLPPDDSRVGGTVEAIQKGLTTEGFVRRYQTDTDENVDGLDGSEGTFLLTSFWLADNLALLGRHDEAKEIFDRLCALCNDVGLLSEEYDPKAGRLLGNFPQAFSHVALINTAANLSMAEHGLSAIRRRRSGPL
jgi:GH15 family glucan-1,4-alpha-glucosidase